MSKSTTIGGATTLPSPPAKDDHLNAWADYWYYEVELSFFDAPSHSFTGSA